MRVFSRGFRELREFIGGSIRSSSDFNEAFTKSTAIMGELSVAMKDKMAGAAEEVAKQTTFAAKEGAEAYFFLASAGLDAAQSIAALPQVAKFAQAGAFDLALATDLLTDAQSALGLTSKDTAENMENMSRVSDVLVKANTLANASVEQFSQALTTKAGAALKILGKDIEEGVAVLAAFADQGVKAQEAGTALNIVLRDLSTKAIKNKEAFAANNVAVFDAAGEMRNIGDIITDLEKRLAGMSDEQAKATLQQLGFADKSVIFIQTLIGMSDKIKEYEEGLRAAGGITGEVASNQMKSFAAQMQLVKNEWTLFLKTLGDFITKSPAVRRFLESLRDVFEEWSEKIVENRDEIEKFVNDVVIEMIKHLKDLDDTVRSLVKTFREVGKDTLRIAEFTLLAVVLTKIAKALGLIKAAGGVGILGAGAGAIGGGVGAGLGAQAYLSQRFPKSVEGLDPASKAAVKLAEVTTLWYKAKDALDTIPPVANEIKSGFDSVVPTFETVEDIMAATAQSSGVLDEQLKKLKESTESLGGVAPALDQFANVVGLTMGFVPHERDIAWLDEFNEEIPKHLQVTQQIIDENMPVLKAFELTGPIIPPEILEARLQADLVDPMAAFNKTLEEAANLALVFGDSFGRAIGGIASAISGGAALFKKGFGGLIEGFKTKDLDTGELTITFGSFAKGLAGALPAIAAIAGPIVQIFSKLFKPAWKKVAEESSKVFGKALSEGLSKELVKVANQLGSTQNAFAARIGDVIAEVGINAGNAKEVLASFANLLGMVENGTLDWAAATEQVNKAFAPIVDHLKTMGVEGSVQIGELISRMRELGQVTGEVQAFIKEKAESAVANLGKYFEYLAKQEELTGEQAAAALTQMAGAFQAAIQAAGSLAGAMEMLGPSFGELLVKMREVLGEENAVLNAMTQYYNFVKENSEQLAAIDALSKGFKALIELGIVNKANISDYAASFQAEFESMLAATEDQAMALAAMGPQIAQLMEAYQAMGLQVPQWLSELAAKAKEAGASLEPPEGLPDILKDIRDIMLSIAEAMGAASKGAKAFGKALGDINAPTGNGANYEFDSAQSGMFKKLKKDTLILAHAGEFAAILPKGMKFVSAARGFMEDRYGNTKAGQLHSGNYLPPTMTMPTLSEAESSIVQGSSAQPVSIEQIQQTMAAAVKEIVAAAKPEINLESSPVIQLQLPELTADKAQEIAQEIIIPETKRALRMNTQGLRDEIQEIAKHG